MLLVSFARALLIFQRTQWSKPFCWICVRVPAHLSPLQRRRAPRINPEGTQGGAPCRDRALSQNGQRALCLSLNQLGSKARLMIVVNVASEKKRADLAPFGWVTECFPTSWWLALARRLNVDKPILRWQTDRQAAPKVAASGPSPGLPQMGKSVDGKQISTTLLHF